MYNLEFYRNRKKQLRLTNKAIAYLSKLPLRTVEDFFRGAYENPRIDTIQAIEDALGLELTAEWNYEERAEGASATRKESIAPIEDEMLYLFREIGKKHGEEAQRALITVAEKML